jgi:DMSO/TMAO reductase YedYZ molybdopterin-dependent catalytic subunit
MISSIIGTEIPFGENMPSGLIPHALANGSDGQLLVGKEGLVILNDFPLNAEVPAHLLDDEITPAKHLFIRNNGVAPKNIDINGWKLTITGESAAREVTFTLSNLKKMFEHVTYQAVLECGGNGRDEYTPSAKGNQWSTGAIGCPSWTGVRLGDVLKFCGVKKDAVYIGYYGADKHLSGNPKKDPISRGFPIEKAYEPETIIAWAMNGEDIPLANGYPLRLICPGFPGSTSGKWLEKIVIRNKVHDGTKMGGYAYRLPCNPVAPGEKPTKEEMCIIEEMPVKSLITYPKNSVEHSIEKSFHFRGKAWSGSGFVAEVFTSMDFGITWQKAKMGDAKNRFSWRTWENSVQFPKVGYYEIWARAVDSLGRSQPMVLPGWNPKGYLNNATHRIAVKVV